MREAIAELATDYPIYSARHEQYDLGEEVVPFLVGTEPFSLNPEQTIELTELSELVVLYIDAIQGLYQEDETVRGLLDRGKPPIFTDQQNGQYLFLRPDLVITERGFTICEIETSPFGLALADILNRAHETTDEQGALFDDEALTTLVHGHTGDSGTIYYSQKTDQYAGQLRYLADNVFSSPDRTWETRHVETDDEPVDEVYRGFYLSEYETDVSVQSLLERIAEQHDATVMPGLTPQFEEKALLAFIWDDRWTPYFVDRLGELAVEKLRQWIPPTFIIGEEEHFEGKLPDGIYQATDLSNLSRKQRAFVLKVSGYDPHASWAEGVTFLHSLSKEKAHNTLLDATHEDGLYVVQEFRQGVKQRMEFEDYDGSIGVMDGRTRLTPYVAAIGDMAGKVVAAKATLVAGSDRIHAGTNSLNTAVRKSVS